MSLEEEYKKFSGGKASTMETVAWLAVQGHKAYKKLLKNIPHNSLECVKTASVVELENQEAAPVPKKSYNNKEYQFIRYAESSGRIIDDIDDNSSFTSFLNQLRSINRLCRLIKAPHGGVSVVPPSGELNEYLDVLRKNTDKGKPDDREKFNTMVDGLSDLSVRLSKNLIPGQLNPIQFGIKMNFGTYSDMTSLYFNFGRTPTIYINVGHSWRELCSLFDAQLFDILAEQADNAGCSDLNKAIPDFLQ